MSSETKKAPWYKRGSQILSQISSQTGSMPSSTSSPALFGFASGSRVDVVHEEIDSRAALDSFKSHWSQAWSVMQRKCVPTLDPITVDDITSIVNHINQMVTLLVQESSGQMMSQRAASNSSSSPIMMSPLLDFLFIESILDKLLTWSQLATEWNQVMTLEQLKLYELLISQVCHQEALFQQPLVRPLMSLLSNCVSKVCPLEVEKRLVVLLNTLCVCLSQNTDLLELFFQNDPLISSHGGSRFLIFTLLIPFVHREGAIGQQARDALLLCMALSRKNDIIGVYIAEESNFCPILATGLSGLYSRLPRSLSNCCLLAYDWHQLTPEDIQDMPELQMFLNSLEFCNAVMQISHPLVQKQLLVYIYNGFLGSVIGPALHQDVVDVPLNMLEKLPNYSNTLEEIIATTAYLELFIRTISEPSLLQAFIKFICTETFEDKRILETLIMRIEAHSKLSLVTLVLFRTLLDLNCEDFLLELVLKYFLMGKHLNEDKEQDFIMKDINCFGVSAQKLLLLIPECCYSCSLPLTAMPYLAANDGFEWITSEDTENGSDSLSSPDNDFGHLMFNYLDYLRDAHTLVSNCMKATRSWSNNYDVENKAQNSFSANHHVPHCNGSQQLNEESSPSPIGPFLTVLFSRLEDMWENDVYMNLHLTGIISRLAAYPQPLLRSFLLNPMLVFRSDIKSLWTILTNLQKQLDDLASNINNFNELMKRAKQFFFVREERLLPDKQIRFLNDSGVENSVGTGSRRGSFSSIASEPADGAPRRRRLPSLRDIFGNKKGLNSSHNNNIPLPNLPSPLQSVSSGQGYRYFNKNHQRTPDEAHDASEMEENERNQKIILATIIFEEFLRELSAISFEHFILEQKDSPNFQGSFDEHI